MKENFQERQLTLLQFKSVFTWKLFSFEKVLVYYTKTSYGCQLVVYCQIEVYFELLSVGWNNFIVNLIEQTSKLKLKTLQYASYKLI